MYFYKNPFKKGSLVSWQGQGLFLEKVFSEPNRSLQACGFESQRCDSIQLLPRRQTFLILSGQKETSPIMGYPLEFLPKDSASFPYANKAGGKPMR